MTAVQAPSEPSPGAPVTAPAGAMTARLRIAGLTKTFGGSRALDAVDLAVMPGEIHGLLGQNGSGKSTLIKILSGFHEPDDGQMFIDGSAVSLPMPVAQHEALGLAFVHQNLGLVPGATVLESLIAGDHGRLNPWKINWRKEADRALRLFADFQLELDPGMLVENLAEVKKAQLAIIRAVDRIRQHAAQDNPGLLILDEPTPFLPAEDVHDLFTMMRRLAKSGVSIIFVSHDIDEVIEITDRATVLRDGGVVGSFETAATPREKIVEMIVGRALGTNRHAEPFADPDAAPRVRVEAIGDDLLDHLSLDVRPGEILGLTGLIGSGYDRIPYLISGATRARAGRLMIDDAAYDLEAMTPAKAIDAGIVLIPADRALRGLSPVLSLVDNISLPVLGKITARGFLHHPALKRNAAGLLQKFTVKCEAPEQTASDLSGGNQQKVVLAKWFQLAPKLIVLDEPTQGIDVGARAEIYRLLNQACAAGTSVICATSEFEQLEAIAHRVLVFDRGQIAKELHSREITKSNIAAACYASTRGERS